MRENRTSGSEGGGMKPIISPYPYRQKSVCVLGDDGSVGWGRPRTTALRLKSVRVLGSVISVRQNNTKHHEFSDS
jgi:hypothetical protein